MGDHIPHEEEPYISIIVTAHDRKEYLRYAIQSAIDQRLEKRLYEIVVVKNFDNKELDELIEENGIESLKAKKDSTIGEDLAAGIENSKGEVLCFLDDDDAFLPNKLKVVFDIFKNDDEIVY